MNGFSIRQWRVAMAMGICFAIILLLFVAGCSQKGKDASGYINHAKWVVYGDLTSRPVKGNPVEVKENAFRNLSDSSLDASGKLTDYILTRFDPMGNSIYLRLEIDTFATIEQFHTYDDNGWQYHSIAKNGTNDTGRRYQQLSVKTGPDKFKQITIGRQENSNGYNILRFENKGERVIRERWRNDALIDKIIEMHSDGKILSLTLYDPGGMVGKKQYYYSAKGLLDSVVDNRIGIITEREVFINNKQGDPVFYEKNVHGKLRARETYDYRYDDKGNWIRKLVYKDPVGESFLIKDVIDSFPNLSLIVREIKY